MTHLATAEREFRSTNISIAVDGLISYKQWLNDQRSVDRTNNYDMALFETEARLFQIFEFLGDSNRADTFYNEAVDSYARHLRYNHFSPDPLTKEEVRDKLEYQQKGQDVGWKSHPRPTNRTATH